MRRTAATVALLLVAVACGADDPSAGIAPSPSPPSPPPTPQVTEPVTAAPGGDGEVATPGAEPAPSPSPAGGATPAPLSTDAWTALAPGPRGFTEIAAAALGGKIFTVGGLSSAARGIETVMVYDPVFDHWEEGPPLPDPLHHTAVVSTGEELLQVGGYRGQGMMEPIAAVHRFDPANGAWEEFVPLPEPRAAGAAAWDGSRVVYAGGMAGGELAGDVYALDLDAGAWTRIGELEHPREHLAAASDGQGRVWFLGGRLGGLGSNQAVVEMVSGDGVEVVGELPTPRGGLSGFHHPTAGACAVGGEDPDRTFAEVECVDEHGEVTVLPPLEVPRHGLGAVVVEDAVYAVFGGHRPGLTFSTAVEALRLR